MREILFKAKRLYDGEWVEGFYVKAELLDGSGSEHVIIEYSRHGTTHIIDPTTICQYTGLTDKNSAKIFEDDKLSDKYGDTGIVKFGWNYGTHGFFCEGAVDDITDNDLLVIGNIHDKENDHED